MVMTSLNHVTSFFLTLKPENVLDSSITEANLIVFSELEVVRVVITCGELDVELKIA